MCVWIHLEDLRLFWPIWPPAPGHEGAWPQGAGGGPGRVAHRLLAAVAANTVQLRAGAGRLPRGVRGRPHSRSECRRGAANAAPRPLPREQPQPRPSASPAPISPPRHRSMAHIDWAGGLYGPYAPVTDRGGCTVLLGRPSIRRSHSSHSAAQSSAAMATFARCALCDVATPVRFVPD